MFKFNVHQIVQRKQAFNKGIFTEFKVKFRMLDADDANNTRHYVIESVYLGEIKVVSAEFLENNYEAIIGGSL